MELGGGGDWDRLVWGNKTAHWVQLFSSVRLSKRWTPFGTHWVWEGHTHSCMLLSDAQLLCVPWAVMVLLVMPSCSGVVWWGSANFWLCVSKKTTCLISLSFMQCVRERKSQAGREGREVNHGKVSVAFCSLSLHTASLLLPAWLHCAGSTQDELEARLDLVSLGLLYSLFALCVYFHPKSSYLQCNGMKSGVLRASTGKVLGRERTGISSATRSFWVWFNPL